MSVETYNGYARHLVLGHQPNKTRINRHCTRKKRFADERQAYLRAVAMSWDLRGNYESYHCAYCYGWHVGSVEGERGVPNGS